MRNAGHILTALSLLGAACGGERQGGAEAERPAESGMPGMTMRMPSMDMLPAMRAYLDSVVAAAPGELTAMVAAHGLRVQQMMTLMDQDMNTMNMTADSAWQALADSVRADLGAIPGLRGEPLVLRMRAHAGRMLRLLDMHERMMRM